MNIISRHNQADLRAQFLFQKFLEAHRLPEFGFVAVSFMLVVVEIIKGVGVGGWGRGRKTRSRTGSGVGGGRAARVMVRVSTADSAALHNTA